MGLGDRILAFGVLLEFAGVDAEEGDVGGEVVAIHQFELEEDEFGTRGIEFEAVPVFAGGSGHRVLAGGAGKREVLQFVAGGGDELAQRDGLGVLPGVVGPGGERPAIDLQSIAARGAPSTTTRSSAARAGRKEP